MTSLVKEIVDSLVVGRGQHQVVQDYHASYLGIEIVIDVQVQRATFDEFYPRNHHPTYLIVEGLSSLVQPDDYPRWWRHLDATVFQQRFNEIRLFEAGWSCEVCRERMTKEKAFPIDRHPLLSFLLRFIFLHCLLFGLHLLFCFLLREQFCREIAYCLSYKIIVDKLDTACWCASQSSQSLL